MARGDVIKLGRLSFRVKDYRNETATTEVAKDETVPREDAVDRLVCSHESEYRCGQVYSAKSGDLCRVCYNEAQTVENPLLSICHCTGTLRFIHYKCVHFWLESKLNVVKLPHICSYYLKLFECEICKTPYPCMTDR